MDESSMLIPASAVAVPLLAFITLIVDFPPLVWHIRNHNIGASSLVSWVILCNFMNFINALIWPTDDISAWWQGHVLCDIEVKLATATWMGVVGSLICIMRSLAKALDTENPVLSSSRAQKQRRLVVELLLCVGAPLYMVAIHYVVQPTRYWITTVMGCVVPFDRSWPSIVLVAMWPAIFSLVVIYYSMLTIHRMHRYRRDFSSILNSSNSNLTKNRFLRLFLMALTLIVIILPAQGYLLYSHAMNIALPYSWSRVHGEHWADILLVPTGGHVTSDRWIQTAFGFAIFMFFGMGHEAKEMYRKWLLHLGLGNVFPSLRQPVKKGSYSLGSNSSSVGSRARLIINRISHKPSLSWHNKTESTSTFNSSGELSPTTERKQSGPLSPISENEERFSGSTFVMPAQVSDNPPRQPELVYTQSWLSNFLINTHLAAPNRRMGAGLGMFGAPTMPRDGVVRYEHHYNRGDGTV